MTLVFVCRLVSVEDEHGQGEYFIHVAALTFSNVTKFLSMLRITWVKFHRGRPNGSAVRTCKNVVSSGKR